MSEFKRLSARLSDVGGIPVARMLPSRHQRTIGAWCFLDHAGPAAFGEGDKGMQVGPHPHIGLQTFTWMIAGEVLHKDSLGSEQVIRPGQVNLMTSGRGISHTEQSLKPELGLHAAQLWIALPPDERNCAPRFDHYPALPQFDLAGFAVTLLIGDYEGHEAPTLRYSPLIGLDLQWDEATAHHFALNPDFEYGIVALEGALVVDDEALPMNELAYLGSGREALAVSAVDRGRALLIGGEPLAETPTIWWNFVGYSKAEITAAQDQWEAGDERFGEVLGTGLSPLSPPPIPW